MVIKNHYHVRTLTNKGGRNAAFMFEEINQSIEVIAKFTGNDLMPVKFLWHGREVLIKKVNLSWSRFEGRVKFYYFAVSDNVNYFKLQFNTDTLAWTLLESYAD